MNGTITNNPDFKTFEEELKKSPPKIQDRIKGLLSKKTPKEPIKVNKEHHTPDQVQNLVKYNEVLNYFGGKIPKNLKETWTNLNNRPDITKEVYEKLVANQKDPNDKTGTLPADLPPNWKDQLAELKKWKEKLKDKDPDQVLKELSAKSSVPEGLPTDWKEQIASVKDLKAKVNELEKRPTQEALNQAIQKEKDKYKDYDDNKKKLTEWQEAFPNQDPKKAKEQQGKETKPADYDSTKEQLKKWTDAFPNSDPEFTGKDPNIIKDNYLKYKNNQAKPKPDNSEKKPANEEEDLGIDDESPESTNKRKLISEIRRLADLFGEKELSNRRIKVYFASNKSKKEILGEKNGMTQISQKGGFDIYLQLDRKDKTGNFSVSLILWTFAQELTHVFIEQQRKSQKESYEQEYQTRFSPLFWKNFFDPEKSATKWIKDNIIKDYQELALINRPTAIANDKINFAEVLEVYFIGSDLGKVYQEFLAKEMESDVLVEDQAVTIGKWIDESWKIVGAKLADLVGQKLTKDKSKEELVNSWAKVSVDYNKNSQEYVIKVSYHKSNSLWRQIEELLVTPLKLEIESLKKEQNALPTSKNLDRLIKQREELKSQLSNFVDKDKYKEIISGIQKI